MFLFFTKIPILKTIFGAKLPKKNEKTNFLAYFFLLYNVIFEIFLQDADSQCFTNKDFYHRKTLFLFINFQNIFKATQTTDFLAFYEQFLSNFATVSASKKSSSQAWENNKMNTNFIKRPLIISFDHGFNGFNGLIL